MVKIGSRGIQINGKRYKILLDPPRNGSCFKSCYEAMTG